MLQEVSLPITANQRQSLEYRHKTLIVERYAQLSPFENKRRHRRVHSAAELEGRSPALATSNSRRATAAAITVHGGTDLDQATGGGDARLPPLPRGKGPAQVLLTSERGPRLDNSFAAPSSLGSVDEDTGFRHGRQPSDALSDAVASDTSAAAPLRNGHGAFLQQIFGFVLASGSC